MAKPSGDWVPDPKVGTDDWVGLTLDSRYHVVSQLGAGGMGFVYKARDKRLGIDVVLKVPRPEMLADKEFRQRFKSEVTALVQLAHPHIVKVTDYAVHEGTPFAVMQFLSGGSMDDRRPRDERNQPKGVSPRTLNEWLAPVADALDFIHQKGFVHRDIKPANILFDGHKHAFVSDFGVAKALAGGQADRHGLTGVGMVLGTPEYLAPEVILGQQFDGRIDQYALAVTLYELLSGNVPFTGPTGPAILVRQTTETAKPLHEVKANIPPALSGALAKAMAKNPAERYATCTALAQAMLAAIGDKAPAVKPPPPPPKPRPRSAAETPRATAAISSTKPMAVRQLPSRPRKLFVGIAAGTLALIGIGIWAFSRPAVPSAKPTGTDVVGEPGPPKPPSLPSPEPPTIEPKTPPRPRQPIIRVQPETLQITAGDDRKTLTVMIDGPFAGPLEVSARANGKVHVDPTRTTLQPGDPSPRFTVSAPESAARGTETVAFEISGSDIAITRTAGVQIRQLDFAIALKERGEVVMRPGQSHSVAVTIDRSGGYRGPVELSLAENSSWQTSRVLVDAGRDNGTIDLRAKSGLTSDKTSAVIRAEAVGRPLLHQLTVPVRLVIFRRGVAFATNSKSPITALAYDRTGGLVLSGSEDGAVHLWTAAGKEKWKFKEHKKAVRSAAFSPDGKRALTGCEDATSILWDPRVEGKLVAKLAGAQGTPIWHVYFQPAGLRQAPFNPANARLINQAAVTVGSDYAALWDEYSDASPLLEKTPLPRPVSSASVEQSVSGDLRLAGHGGDALEVRRGSVLIATLPGNGSIQSMILSGNGRRALTLDADGTIRIWDVGAHRLVAGGAWKPAVKVTAAALDADGSHVLCGTADGQLNTWKVP